MAPPHFEQFGWREPCDRSVMYIPIITPEDIQKKPLRDRRLVTAQCNSSIALELALESINKGGGGLNKEALILEGTKAKGRGFGKDIEDLQSDNEDVVSVGLQPFFSSDSEEEVDYDLLRDQRKWRMQRDKAACEYQHTRLLQQKIGYKECGPRIQFEVKGVIKQS
jgi:hypothetical protein